MSEAGHSPWRGKYPEGECPGGTCPGEYPTLVVLYWFHTHRNTTGSIMHCVCMGAGCGSDLRQSWWVGSGLSLISTGPTLCVHCVCILSGRGSDFRQSWWVGSGLGLISTGVHRWVINWPEWLNDLLQVLQLKDRSSEWLRMWTVNLADCLNFLPQTLQLKGWSPEWTRMCLLNWDKNSNFLSQSLQVKALSVV